MRHVQRYDGKVAVVTGTSSGLGRRLSIDLADRGATVVGVARRADLLEQLGAELRRRSADSDTRACDVSDTGSLAAVIRAVEERHGRIDILVNNAGLDEPTPSVGPAVARPSNVPTHRRIFEVNYFAAVTGTEAALPGMCFRGSGVIVNVSSDIVRVTTPPHTAYAASKAALSAYSEGIAFELAPEGVSVHVLYPGWMPTEMGRQAGREGIDVPKLARRTVEQVSRLTLERMGGPRVEIAAVPIAALTPIVKALMPSVHARLVARQIP